MFTAFQMRSHSALETNIHNLLSAVKVLSSDTHQAHICFSHGCMTAVVHAHPTPQQYSKLLPQTFPSVVSDTIEIIFDPQVTVPFVLLNFNQFILLVSQGPLLSLCDLLVLRFVDLYRLHVSLANVIGKITFFAEVPKQNNWMKQRLIFDKLTMYFSPVVFFSAWSGFTFSL